VYPGWLWFWGWWLNCSVPGADPKDWYWSILLKARSSASNFIWEPTRCVYGTGNPLWLPCGGTSVKWLAQGNHKGLPVDRGPIPARHTRGDAHRSIEIWQSSRDWFVSLVIHQKKIWANGSVLCWGGDKSADAINRVPTEIGIFLWWGLLHKKAMEAD
jgi:hypothetical protein